jgi:hypothetical protein
MCVHARREETREKRERERERVVPSTLPTQASERGRGPTTHTCTCGAHSNRASTSFEVWTDWIPSASDPTSSLVASSARANQLGNYPPPEPDPHARTSLRGLSLHRWRTRLGVRLGRVARRAWIDCPALRAPRNDRSPIRPGGGALLLRDPSPPVHVASDKDNRMHFMH